MQEQPASNSEPQQEDNGVDWIGLSVLLFSLGLWALFWTTDLTLPFLVLAVVVISIVIWQACDPFADAAQWIGDTYHLPGSVRGATLDAVASSLPELFTGVFFVLLAMAEGGDDAASQAVASGEGYGSTIATCAGSAVYNMILIPAFCALVISFRRRNRPTIDVEDKVIARDGLVFVVSEALLVYFLFGNSLSWWVAICFFGIYIAYITFLYRDWKRFETVKQVYTKMGLNTDPQEVLTLLTERGLTFGLPAVQQVQDELQRGDEEDDGDDASAGVFFGIFEVPLSHLTVWPIIILSTIVAAGACYWLVEVTRETAAELNVPTFFVAVILAAAASSVPDTFLSIGAARRGDDSGAVSNAFGSNIFDICICLSIPLLINSYLMGWQPVSLLQEGGKPIAGLVELRFLLLALTIVTLFIMWHNRQLTRRKGLVLCGLYGVFIAYAVLGSLGFSF